MVFALQSGRDFNRTHTRCYLYGRRGVGLRLLQRLIADCESRGYRQMIAVIGDSANAGSIGVHAKCGFQMIGTHPDVGFKFGRWLDTVMMQRALGAGGATLPVG